MAIGYWKLVWCFSICIALVRHKPLNRYILHMLDSEITMQEHYTTVPCPIVRLWILQCSSVRATDGWCHLKAHMTVKQLSRTLGRGMFYRWQTHKQYHGSCWSINGVTAPFAAVATQISFGDLGWIHASWISLHWLSHWAHWHENAIRTLGVLGLDRAKSIGVLPDHLLSAEVISAVPFE